MEEYKIPQEQQPLPPEHQTVVTEYSIPEEFPVLKPQETTKKKSNARRWMAVLASSFMVLQLVYTYFVPPTKDDLGGPGYTEPGYVDPGYTDPGYVNPGGSGSTDRPPYDIRGFEVKSLSPDKDDGIVREKLAVAAEHFEQFDYVRASLALYNSMQYYTIGMDVSSLAHVGYSIVNGVVKPFDENAANACHVYYFHDEVYFENKIGELEAEYGVRATMVQIQHTEEGKMYRIISVWISNYRMFEGSVDFNADYIEGIFAEDGSAESCTRINFIVFESPNYANFDGIYEAWPQRKYTGAVKNNAFMNGTTIETNLVYEDGKGIIEDPAGVAQNIRIDCLDENGVVDLKHPALVDMTGDYDSEVWDKFYSDPAIRYGAYAYSLCCKFGESDERAWIDGIEITKPLLPIVTHEALCFGQLLANQTAQK